MTLLELAYNLSVLACKLTCVHACSHYTIYLRCPGIEVLAAVSASRCWLLPQHVLRNSWWQCSHTRTG